MTEGLHWRWVLGRRLKGLPVERTFEERYRAPVLEGPGTLEAGVWTHWFPSCRFFTWTPEDRISLGAYTSIAAGSRLLCGGVHHVESLSTFGFRMMTGEDVHTEIDSSTITIGSDVWMATEAVVLAGVTVGDGAVVAARSVVTSDIPPYAIVAGAPARIIRYRFSDEVIRDLTRLKWWDWPEDAVRRAAPLLRASDFNALVAFGRAENLMDSGGLADVSG